MGGLSVCGLAWHFQFLDKQWVTLSVYFNTNPSPKLLSRHPTPSIHWPHEGWPVAGWLPLAGWHAMPGMCCTHTLLNHDTFSCGAGDGFFQKALIWNQESKFSSSTVAALSLSGADLGLMALEVPFCCLFSPTKVPDFVGSTAWDDTWIYGCLDKLRKVPEGLFITLFNDKLTDLLNWPDVANPSHLVPCDYSNKHKSLQISDQLSRGDLYKMFSFWQRKL